MVTNGSEGPGTPLGASSSGRYIKQPRVLAKEFGECFKAIRKTKLRPPRTHGRGSSLTQADVALELHDRWQYRTGEDRVVDAAWIRKLEAGKLLVPLALATCLAEAVK